MVLIVTGDKNPPAPQPDGKSVERPPKDVQDKPKVSKTGDVRGR